MLQVTFQSDGKVQVVEMMGGDVISVTTDGHRLPAMLPGETAEALWRCIAELHETLGAAISESVCPSAESRSVLKRHAVQTGA